MNLTTLLGFLIALMAPGDTEVVKHETKTDNFRQVTNVVLETRNLRITFEKKSAEISVSFATNLVLTNVFWTFPHSSQVPDNQP